MLIIKITYSWLINSITFQATLKLKLDNKFKYKRSKLSTEKILEMRNRYTTNFNRKRELLQKSESQNGNPNKRYEFQPYNEN